MGWGGWAENEKKLSLFWSHQLGCCQGDKASDGRVCVCVPLLPSDHFLPRLGDDEFIASGPEEGPLVATVRRRVGLGVVRKILPVDKAPLKKALPLCPGGQEQVGPRKCWRGPPCGPGRDCPALPVLLATL